MKEFDKDLIVRQLISIVKSIPKKPIHNRIAQIKIEEAVNYLHMVPPYPSQYAKDTHA